MNKTLYERVMRESAKLEGKFEMPEGFNMDVSAIEEQSRKAASWWFFTNPSFGNRRRALNRWRRRYEDHSRRNKLVSLVQKQDEDTGLLLMITTKIKDGWEITERVEIMYGVALASRALPLLEL